MSLLIALLLGLCHGFLGALFGGRSGLCWLWHPENSFFWLLKLLGVRAPPRAGSGRTAARRGRVRPPSSAGLRLCGAAPLRAAHRPGCAPPAPASAGSRRRAAGGGARRGPGERLGAAAAAAQGARYGLGTAGGGGGGRAPAAARARSPRRSGGRAGAAASGRRSGSRGGAWLRRPGHGGERE